MNSSLAWIGSYLSKHWYERSVSIFIAIIVMSCLSIFEGYWWPESFTIAYRTLIFVALVDILLPMSMRFFRYIVQLLVTVYITFRFARMERYPFPSGEEGRTWRWWFEQTLEGLTPFIWIALALLFIHMLCTAWALTRVRMFGIIGTAILILTVADSFSPIWLWDNVVTVVFVGLAWLILNHLRKLEREHPNSMRDLLEYPVRVFTPAVLILSILLVIALNVPSIAPLLQDPYTIWKESRGETVQVFLGDKAIINDKKNNSGLNTSSGYSRNDDSLGGGFNYDYSPVMTVSTSKRSYWRGESKAVYTGEGWVDIDFTDAVNVWKGEPLQESYARELVQTQEIYQTVTMDRKDIYPILFGAAPISTLVKVDEETAGMQDEAEWWPNEGELRWNVNRTYPETYSITSNVTVLDEEGLRTVESRLPDTGMNQLYLQLPDTITERVRALALEITAEASNDYDKAKLLETYLKNNFIYNNKPDMSKLTGDSDDFVDQFLFELLEGYCDYFSTTMAVMARTLDLPSRWVKGFSPGVLPIDRYGFMGDMMDYESINPSGSGSYTVRNSDAHSWVEVYFAGYGWIPFEPTAGFTFPYSIPEGEEHISPDLNLGEDESLPDIVAEQPSDNGVWGWVAVTAVLAIAGAAAVWFMMSRGYLPSLWGKFKRGTYNTNELIVMEANRLLRACKKRGLQREEHETMREAVVRWSQDQKRLKDDFRFVLDGFEKAKYSGSAASKEEVDRYTNKVRYLIGELK